MTNRLATATSPYLQQHADNPVEWYEWGPEAFAEARRRDVPLLLSVGYSACHWCHVMAHESFEDEATAAVVNAGFVAVKVDREERPDVDAVYMAATQAMTGQGGWPMTVFATPDGDPFFCGTYYPPRPAGGMPSFGQVLEGMRAAWTGRRAEVEATAAALGDALAGRRSQVSMDGVAGPAGRPSGTPASIDRATLDAVLAVLAQIEDRSRGGFGGAPKFPPSMLLEWLLRRGASAARHPERPSSQAPSTRATSADTLRVGDQLAVEALAMAGRTLSSMARGGIYDQLGGGFARYSVDPSWVVPHFEKMLYDNALLLRVYAHWWRASGDPLALRVATETADWLLRELRTPEGGFASALDADSVGPDGRSHEGAFYAWSPDQLVEALGADDGPWAADVWGVTPAGTFEHGTSVLQLRADPAGPADLTEANRVADPSQPARYEAVRARAFEARASRPRPARDDKVVTAWNGLAIAALADAGALLARPDWLDAARTAADLLLRLHLRRDDVLRVVRTSRAGRAGTAPGVLEDYANLAEGLLALYTATGERRWSDVAGELLGEVLERFADGAGGFFDTADDETDPVLLRVGRPREPVDGPTPSGPSAAAGALLTWAALTGSRRHREAAEQALAEPLQLARRYPHAAGWALAVGEALLDGPREVAVAGAPDDELTRVLRRVVALSVAPGAVLAAGDPDAAGPAVPLLADRPLVAGRPTAYVCREFVCALPTSDPSELAALLAP